MKKIIIFITIMILILSFENIKALTLTQEVTKIGDGYFTTNNSNFTVDGSNYFTTINQDSNIQFLDITFTENQNTADADYIAFPFQLGIPGTTVITTTQQVDYDYCHRWNCNLFNTDGTCQRFVCDSLYTNTDTSVDREYVQYTLTQFQIYPRIYYADNTANSCFFNDNYIMCPTNNKNVKQLQLQVLFNPVRSTSVKIGISRAWQKFKNQNIQSAIEQQTQQQQQNFNNFMNETTTYDDQQNTNITGVNETIEYEQMEQNLIESLDLNGSVLDSITINPNASVFIWNIVEVLRSMNPAIILLMTSILGLGIIKLVLNR